MKKQLGFMILSAIAGACMIAGPARAGSLTWDGNVDDRATIYLKGSKVTVTSNMGGASDQHYHVVGTLPRRRIRVHLQHWQGRGQIRLIQRPSAANGYTAEVQIHDHSKGSSHYAFALKW